MFRLLSTCLFLFLFAGQASAQVTAETVKNTLDTNETMDGIFWGDYYSILFQVNTAWNALTPAQQAANKGVYDSCGGNCLKVYDNLSAAGTQSIIGYAQLSVYNNTGVLVNLANANAAAAVETVWLQGANDAVNAAWTNLITLQNLGN